LALGALQGNYKRLIPIASAQEASLIDGVEVYGAQNLVQLVDFLLGNTALKPAQSADAPGSLEAALDLLDAKGQAKAKRALEIAAAGGHHLLMSGTPVRAKPCSPSGLWASCPSLAAKEPWKQPGFTRRQAA
jgi:magnesium chelatase family protein